MPIYEYRCQGCKEQFELLVQKLDQKIICPYCGSDDAEKLLSVPASIRMGKSDTKGKTCCGRSERCDFPPCSDGGNCDRDGGN